VWLEILCIAVYRKQKGFWQCLGIVYCSGGTGRVFEEMNIDYGRFSIGKDETPGTSDVRPGAEGEGAQLALLTAAWDEGCMESIVVLASPAISEKLHSGQLLYMQRVRCYVAVYNQLSW
jgi:hypothetical protein